MMSLAIGINLLPVFLTNLSSTFDGSAGLSKEELGRLGGICFSGLVLGILVAGPLADRCGPKLFTIVGNGAIAVSLAGMAMAPNYLWLAIALFILGFGAGILDMILSPVVAALNPEQRSAAMNWLHSFYCVGAVVTILAGTLALNFNFGWRHACLVLIPLPFTLLLIFVFLDFPLLVAETAGQPSRIPLRRLLAEPWFRATLVAIFLGGATELGMAQWLPAFAETTLRFPQWTGGAALLLFSVFMALGRMSLGSLSHRLNPFIAMAWCCVCSVVLFIIGSFSPNRNLALLACILVGFTGSALWPTLLAVAADRFPSGGATMFAALAALGNAGGIFMPWLVGFVGDLAGLRWGLAVSALAPLLLWPLVLHLKTGATTTRSVPAIV
jgi:fucose permease